MAPKKIALFIEIGNEREFQSVLKEYERRLICAEVYSSFVGSCTAMDRLFTTAKLDWSDGKMILLKVPADIISDMKRFRNQSEPVYMFILNRRTTKVIRGTNPIIFAQVIRKELDYYKTVESGTEVERLTYQIDQPTPDETEWIKGREMEKMLEMSNRIAKKKARQAARKRYRAELMVPHLMHLNFILYWPHARHVHPDVYERLDINNIIMIGREELLLTKENAEDVLYEGDAPVNEASMHQLMSGPSLAICFRLLDTEKHFVSLVRSILYKEIPAGEGSKVLNNGALQNSAFELYKTYSPTREEVRQRRQENKQRRKEEEEEKQRRRLSEMQRLARQAMEEALELKKKEKERRKLDLLKSGNLEALGQMDEDDTEEISICIPQELPETLKEDSSSEDDDEYLPPAGLPIPGFYTPPSDIAKANGLAMLFPKLVSQFVVPQQEFLPPHVLVMLNISQRYRAVSLLRKFKTYIIHMGIFRATGPYDAVHVAFSVHQYDQLNYSFDESRLRLSFMLSIESDIPLLHLMELNPLHVSRDPETGEDECAAVFPINYAESYPEFEDF